jgi:hypothetical protein
MQAQTAEPQKIFGTVDSSRGRDFELVDIIGRQGVVAIEHVMARLGVREAAAYRRVAACIERGLLERIDLLRREPSLIRATRAGLRYAGLGLPVAVISPGAVDHWLRCATTAELLAAEFGVERVISERELRAAERLEGKAIASAKLGELPSGHPRLHRPDLVVLPTRWTDPDYISASDWGASWPSSSRTQGGRRRERTEVREQAGPTEDNEMRSATGLTQPIAVEVELTPKAPRRLLSIIRAWRGAECVDAVRYYCAPGPTVRGVERAVGKAYAEKKIQILEAVTRR